MSTTGSWQNVLPRDRHIKDVQMSQKPVLAMPTFYAFRPRGQRAVFCNTINS